MSAAKRVFNLPTMIAVVLVAALLGVGATVLVFTQFVDRSARVEDELTAGEVPDGDEALSASGLCYTEPPSLDSEARGNTICYEIEADKVIISDVSSANQAGVYEADDWIEFQITLTARHESSTRLQLESAYLDLEPPATPAGLSEIRVRPAKVYACTDSIPSLCQVSPSTKTLVFRYLVQSGHDAEKLVVKHLVLGEDDYILGPQGENLLPDGDLLTIDQEFDFTIDAPPAARQRSLF